MKELRVGDVSLYTEDNDSWNELIKVIKKANKAYLKAIKEIETERKESWIRKLFRKIQKSLRPQE